MHTRGNDYSCVVGQLRARALLQEDRFDVIGRYEGPRHREIKGSVLRELFGPDADVEPREGAT